MKPVTVIVALVVAGLVLAGAVILSASGPRAAARTPQRSAATANGNGCTATTPSSMVMPTSAVAGDPPAGGALRGRIDALTPPVRPPTAYQAAPATPTTGCTTAGGQAWDPGNIISDQVFYNTSSMTVEQIRDFITTHGEGCGSPWCLKSVRTTVPAQPADQYCQAIPGATDVDAATVIATVSTSCGINPQVMLITLQKESQLLDRTDPTETTYNAAWGWHCPDTGPGGTANCDPAYAGLLNQAYGMAKQWARYRVDPGKYNYQTGQTVTILWNVAESGCGGAPVTIANRATAALYNYTPYQPNAASLAAYPGTGDACSTYGNRNFFYLFLKNFGPTGGGKPNPNPSGSGTVSATGPDVTIPNNPNVTPAVAGRAITAAAPAVATGLAAGFNALGLPYVWGGGGGGAGPDNGCSRGGGDYNSCGSEIGFDCSGLTAYVIGQAGFTIPDNSGGQRAAGAPVAWEQGQPGDIVGFPGHVAIYLGTIDGTRYILEASWVGTPIHVVPLTRTDFDPELHRYWS
jgi:cell wall-associated NlpC family hydrolase